MGWGGREGAGQRPSKGLSKGLVVRECWGPAGQEAGDGRLLGLGMHPGVARDLAPGHEPLVQLLEVVDPRSLSLYNETVPYEAIEPFLLASALGPLWLGMDDVDPEPPRRAPQPARPKRCSSVQLQ